MTVRKADIDKTLAEIAKYPKKNREILFVEDRAQYVLTSDFLTTAGQKRRDADKVGQYGDLGQFTDFLNGASQPSEYTYLQADSIYALEGKGGVGFLMLDADDKLVYAANALNFFIPSCVGNDFTIYSVDAGGAMHEVVKGGEGAEIVWLTTAGELADSLSAKAIKATIGGVVNGSDFKYMRQLVSEGNLSSIDLSEATVKSGGQAYYESYRSTPYTMGNHVFFNLKKLISIRLPLKVKTIDENAFAYSGLKEIIIPDAVTEVGKDAFAYCGALNRVVVGEKVKSLAQGVFYSSNVKDAYVKPMTPPAVSSYLFTSNPVIHVYSKALKAYQASPWAEFGTLVGDLDNYAEISSDIQLPSVEDKQPNGKLSNGKFYDLFGRRVTRLQPGSIYIRNGKKFVFRK